MGFSQYLQIIRMPAESIWRFVSSRRLKSLSQTEHLYPPPFCLMGFPAAHGASIEVRVAERVGDDEVMGVQTASWSVRAD